MKLVLVPPYRGAGYDFRPENEPYYLAVLDRLRSSGQLDGVEVEIDPGVHTDHVSASRDQSLFDHLAVAVQERVRSIVERGEHDGIVVLGAIDVGFDAVRAISPIPVAAPLHSSLHLASLIADRFSVIDTSDPQAARVRRLTRAYGFDHKLLPIRRYESSSTAMSPILRAAAGGQRSAEIDDLVGRVVATCTRAIEEDGAEALIVGFTPLQVMQDEVRAGLDDAGHAEVPVIWSLSAAVATVKAMIEMGVSQSARTYPTDALVSKPATR